MVRSLVPGGTLRLAHEVHGPRDAAPLVLLHPFPLDGSFWGPHIEWLVGLGYRVIVPDLRGFGKSKARDEPATMEAMAKDVYALLDRLQARRVVLGGCSMGGYVALAMQASRPDAVRGLWLVCTRSEADAPGVRASREAQAAGLANGGLASFADSLVPRLVAPADVTRNPGISSDLRSRILAANPTGVAAALRGMALRPDHRARLAQIRTPTLVVAGAEDAVIPVAAAETLRDGILGARLAIIPGAGHLVPAGHPDGLRTVSEPFLAPLTWS